MIDAAKLRAEIERAKDRQVACFEHGDWDGEEAWHGYTRALRWVEAQGVPAAPAEPASVGDSAGRGTAGGAGGEP
jgi:hypothetical protein